VDDRLNLFVGAAAGAVVAVIFVWLTNRINAARKKAGERHKGQIGNDKKSATQVHRESIIASFAWMFWILVLVGFLAALGYGAYLLLTR